MPTAEKGTQFLAIAPSTERDRLSDEICEGLVYYITNFKIVAAPTRFKPVVSSRGIIFGRDTKVKDCCLGYQIPSLKFTSQDLSKIPTYLDKTKKLIGVAGVLVVTTNIRDTLGVENVEIQIMDERAWVSLWGLNATVFKIELRLHRKMNQVLLIAALLVKIKGGGQHCAQQRQQKCTTIQIMEIWLSYPKRLFPPKKDYGGRYSHPQLQPQKTHHNHTYSCKINSTRKGNLDPMFFQNNTRTTIIGTTNCDMHSNILRNCNTPGIAT